MPRSNIIPVNEIHTTPGRRFEKTLLRHRWIHDIIACLAECGLTAMIWPRFFAPFRWQLRHVPMPFPHLSPPFQGYKILFISDLHIGRTNLQFLHEAIISAQKQTSPDLILIGGDLIDYRPESLAPLRATLPLFSAPDGVLAVFGNHDYREYSWRHNGQRSSHRHIHRKLAEALDQSAVRVLRNDAAIIHRGDARLQIAGMDEMWADRLDADLAFSKISPEHPTICMQHNPDGVELLKNFPWHWLLAGHSHGGQVHLPLFGAVYVPMAHRQYLRSHFDFSTPNAPKTMYVSTGIGYTQPLRMHVPPEIVLFTLENRPGASRPGGHDPPAPCA